MNILSSEPFACFKCGAPYTSNGPVGRQAVCLKYDTDLHCCLNCRFYSPNAGNECDEPKAEWVRDKDRANYRDYFKPRRGSGAGFRTPSSRDSGARFEDLFKK